MPLYNHKLNKNARPFLLANITKYYIIMSRLFAHISLRVELPRKEVTFMTALAITNPKWVISENHKNIFHVRDDRERFDNFTRGKVVVYGVHTLETLPSKKPLAGRTNIILTHNRTIRIPGAITVGNINELHFVLRNYDTDDVFVIGGALTFAELIDECKTAILTVTEDKTDDTPGKYEYFPNLDQRENWIAGKASSEHLCDGHCWRYVTYTNTLFRKHSKVAKA